MTAFATWWKEYEMKQGVNMDDQTPRYAPETIWITTGLGFRELPVTRYIAHNPGNHPKGCPIKAELTALELQTWAGSRWFGFEKCWINSELKMIVQGFSSRDEVRMKWKVCKTS